MSHKHSFSVPSTPANARNRALSSAAISSVKSERIVAPPVTPQRLPRAHKYQIGSPYTPASSFSTPYTPLSFRSVASSNDTTLNTPESAPNAKRLSFSLSSDVDVRKKDKSLADIAQNWRSRANENGIRVSSAPDDPHYADDEASDHTPSKSNSPEFNETDDALLPPPFLSSHRRARAQSHAVLPRAPISPQVLRTPARKTLGVLNTPPPKPTYAQQVKLGSLTDPPHTRRRPSFNHPTTQLSDIDENDYVSYPQCFYSSAGPIGLHHSLNDPFHSPLSAISESEPQRFSLVNFNPQSHVHFQDVQRKPSPQKIDILSCSVCGRSSGALAILEPCGHPLCSACLTSALNIVGEKDMECAVCKMAVEDFHLRGTPGQSSQATTTASSPAGISHSISNIIMGEKSFFDPIPSLTSSPNRTNNQIAVQNGSGLLPSAFDVNGIEACIDHGSFFDGARASTPVFGRQASPRPAENIVLRVDNVPWDITPPAIIAWLKQPVVCVHVLLDRKGKTLSHAFVEVADEAVAKAALRGAQNSVLGKGKRARGVTVTRSGQEELMRALFPSWKGHFDGSRPSLAGLNSEKVISTLETGLMSDEELTSLLHLIRSPDSHFLKVPSLPFHSLISLLSKFPADIDSRVFWSGSLRDTLYDVMFTAAQTLLSQITANENSGDLDLLSQLFSAGIKCKAFTSQQIKNILGLLDSASLTLSTSDTSSPAVVHTPDGDDRPDRSEHAVPAHTQPVPCDSRQCHDLPQGPYGALAREFGVETQLVHALAQRLSAMY